MDDSITLPHSEVENVRFGCLRLLNSSYLDYGISKQFYGNIVRALETPQPALTNAVVQIAAVE